MPPTPTPTATSTVPPTVTETPLPSEPVSACVVRRTLRLRSQPTTTSTILGGLLAGTCLKILGTNSEGDWGYVESAKGSGWVALEYLEASGDVGQLPVLPDVPELAQVIEAPSVTLAPPPTLPPPTLAPPTLRPPTLPPPTLPPPTLAPPTLPPPTLPPPTSTPRNTDIPPSPTSTQAGVPAAVNTMVSRGYSFQFHREQDPYWEANSPTEGWTFRVYNDGGFAVGGRFDKDQNAQTQASSDFFQALGITSDQVRVTVQLMVDAVASPNGEASVCDQGLCCDAQVVQAQHLYLWICKPQP
jgi:hypothetical protein